MSGLSIAHRVALTALLAQCPEAALRAVSAAVGSMTGDRADELRMIVAEEVRERARRTRVLAPLLPMFRPRTDGVAALVFPAHVLPRLWRAAREGEPHLLSHLDRDEPTTGVVADRFCQAAAAAARDQPDLVWPPDGDEAARRTGLDDLAACLDLAHLARRGLRSLEVWLRRPDEDQVAELRLLLRDCAEVHPDGAARLLEILFAHIDDAVLILRIVVQTSLSAGQEGFLSESELAGFVDRLIAGVEGRVGRIEAFRPGADAAMIDELIADLDWCAGVLGELDVTLTLNPQSAWGKSVRDARLSMAGRLSGLLRAADRAVEEALPSERVQITGRMTRKQPVVTTPVQGPRVDAALGLLKLVGSSRGPASTYGCEAHRKSLVDDLTARLSDHADHILRLVNDGEAEDEAHALALIELTARCLDQIEAVDPARTVRRRAAVAGGGHKTVRASSRAL